MRKFLCAVAGALLAAPCLWAVPAITLSQRIVSVSGITPGAEVAWLSVAREIEDNSARVVRRGGSVLDDDKDGTVRWEIDRGVPWQSIWAAVDLASGAVALATPDGYPLRDVTPQHPGHGNGLAGRQDWDVDDRAIVHLLIARPGGGAWTITTGDGGDDDASRPGDGRLVASLARLHALGAAPAPPERFNPRDIVIAIDPDRMEVFVERLPEAKP